jgi:hypothetical protein
MQVVTLYCVCVCACVRARAKNSVARLDNVYQNLWTDAHKDKVRFHAGTDALLHSVQIVSKALPIFWLNGTAEAFPGDKVTSREPGHWTPSDKNVK